ncbi:MAG: glycosyltransferase family 2 protein [Bythopirellula sp.]
MWTGWIHWLSSIAPDELLLIVMPLICLDGVRYCFASVAMCLWDTLRGFWHRNTPPQPPYYPDVCVILAGLNEAETIVSTLESVWNSYPKLEIIVVDDGSSDGMADLARQFAATHNDVLVLRKPNRGGKSSALNFAIPFTKAEVVICVDTDSHLEPNAIYEIVQPFADPRVGAVAGTVLARNADVNVVSQLQAAEYLRSIFLGRMLSSRLGILGIVSGAFGAFRRDAIMATGGWDVGPGEDGDLVLRLRKAAWKIVHAPYAQCLTNVPLKWQQLFRQRRRWEWAIVTFECRKHVDLANVWSPNFRISNLMMLLETWIFRIVLTFAGFLVLGWLAATKPDTFGYVLLTNYVLYCVLEFLQWLVMMVYTPKPHRDVWSLACLPLVPPYYIFLKVASLVAMVEEFLWRRSYQDNFVPVHVRQVTWHW